MKGADIRSHHILVYKSSLRTTKTKPFTRANINISLRHIKYFSLDKR